MAIALWSEGARERMSHVLADHRLHNLTPVVSWPQAAGLPKHAVALAVLGIESGFETEDAAIISEQDILGDRLVRPRRAIAAGGEFHRRGRPASRPATWSCMSITASAASSACRRSKRPARRTTAWKSITPTTPSCSCRWRTSTCCRATARRRSGVELDRLGGGNWQARKARMKSRIREIAGELIKIAAERQLREAPRLDGRAGRL